MVKWEVKTVGAWVVYVQGKCGLLSIFKCGVEFNSAVYCADIYTCISALESVEARVRMSCKGTPEEWCDCVKLSLWFSAQYNVYQKSHPGSIFFLYFIRLLKFKNNLIFFCDKWNKKETYKENLITSFLLYPKSISTKVIFVSLFSLSICAYTYSLVYLVFLIKMNHIIHITLKFFILNNTLWTLP